MIKAATVVNGNILDAFFSPRSSVRSSALRASAAHSFQCNDVERKGGGRILQKKEFGVIQITAQNRRCDNLLNNGNGATKNE